MLPKMLFLSAFPEGQGELDEPHFFHPTLRDKLDLMILAILTNNKNQNLYSRKKNAFTVPYEHLGFLCPSDERQHVLWMEISPIYSEQAVKSRDFCLQKFMVWMKWSSIAKFNMVFKYNLLWSWCFITVVKNKTKQKKLRQLFGKGSRYKGHEIPGSNFYWLHKCEWIIYYLMLISMIFFTLQWCKCHMYSAESLHWVWNFYLFFLGLAVFSNILSYKGEY